VDIFDINLTSAAFIIQGLKYWTAYVGGGGSEISFIEINIKGNVRARSQ